MSALAGAAVRLSAVSPDDDDGTGPVVRGCLLAPPSLELASLRLIRIDSADGADPGGPDAVPEGGSRPAPFDFTLAFGPGSDGREWRSRLAATRLRATAVDGRTRDWALLRAGPAPLDPWPDRPARLGVAFSMAGVRPDDVRATILAFLAHTPDCRALLLVDPDRVAEPVAPFLAASGLRRLVGQPGEAAKVSLEQARRFLLDVAGCDVVALFAPGVRPVRDGWARDWVAASMIHGHAHSAPEGDGRGLRPGRGLWFDPALGAAAALGATIASAPLLLRAGPVPSASANPDDPAPVVLARYARRLAAVSGGPDDAIPLLVGDVASRPVWPAPRRHEEAAAGVAASVAASIAEVD